MKELIINLPDENATIDIGKSISQICINVLSGIPKDQFESANDNIDELNSDDQNIENKIIKKDHAESTPSLDNSFNYALDSALVIYLEGHLGAGKTTFSRGFLRGLGYEGAVKSPTFTIVEPYELDNINVYHFDLYRVSDPEELLMMGIEDYCKPGAVCLIEWAHYGQGCLPKPDLLCELKSQDQGREIKFTAKSTAGDAVLTSLNN